MINLILYKALKNKLMASGKTDLELLHQDSNLVILEADTFSFHQYAEHVI